MRKKGVFGHDGNTKMLTPKEVAVKQGLMTQEESNNLSNLADTSLEQVFKFHKKFKHSLGSEEPTIEETTLRLNLIFEELTELADAFGVSGSMHMLELCKNHFNANRKKDYSKNRFNKEEVLDALADLRFVTDGTVLTCGMNLVHTLAMNEVFRSNMSKACITEQDRIDTLAKYKEQGIAVTIDEDGIVTRDSDNKILKSANYMKANFDRLVAVWVDSEEE